MRRFLALGVLATATAALPAAATAAETLRNPSGTAAPPSSTLRNPVTSGASPQPQGGSAAGASIGGGGPTRPPKGADAQSAPSSQEFAPSGSFNNPRNLTNSGAAGSVGYGSPGANNPAGANGGTTPAGQGASTPNGGTAVSGSKSAPMRANGVRKVE